MKRKLALIIAFMLCCTLLMVSCGDKEKKNGQTETQTTARADLVDQDGEYKNDNWLGWDTTEN